MGKAQQGRVGDPAHLLDDGLVYLLLAMTVGNNPQGRDTIQVSAAVDVNQIGALSLLDDHRLHPLIVLHLGKGVPDVSLVRLRQPPLPRHGLS
jgi:hypothetical protein